MTIINILAKHNERISKYQQWHVQLQRCIAIVISLHQNQRQPYVDPIDISPVRQNSSYQSSIRSYIRTSEFRKPFIISPFLRKRLTLICLHTKRASNKLLKQAISQNGKTPYSDLLVIMGSWGNPGKNSGAILYGRVIGYQRHTVTGLQCIVGALVCGTRRRRSKNTSG